MRTLLIVNPSAGQGRPACLRDNILRLLRDRGLEPEVSATFGPGDAQMTVRNAVARGCDRVIVAGGDGTVNEAVNGLAGSETSLAIIPTGTVNVLAREMGIPFDIPAAAAVAAGSGKRLIDLGVANGRSFTLMAGCGFDAEVVASVPLPVKDIIGYSAYVIKGLETLARYRATDVTLEFDGRSFSMQAFAVIVANSPLYAYPLQVAPHALHDDGMLDVCVFQRRTTDRIGFLRQLVDVYRKRHLPHEDVRFFRTASLRIISDPPVMMQLDGELCGMTPAEISVMPRALSLIVPQGALQNLHVR